jgi:ribonuclease HII
MQKLFEFDKRVKLAKKIKYIAGVDEAGRGPWAGPVMGASVILREETLSLSDLKDSKLLTPEKREILFEIIIKEAVAYNVYSADEKVIDSVNILEATKIVFQKCINNIHVKPDLVLVDGNAKIPNIKIPQICIIDGDKKSAAIAAASILAKVTRDRLMVRLSLKYPEYEFAKHKGYGTALHMEKIKLYGPCEIHRKSFKPIREFSKTTPIFKINY